MSLFTVIANDHSVRVKALSKDLAAVRGATKLGFRHLKKKPTEAHNNGGSLFLVYSTDNLMGTVRVY